MILWKYMLNFYSLFLIKYPVIFLFSFYRNKRIYNMTFSYLEKTLLTWESNVRFSHLTRRTMKDPSFIPSANCDPSGLKDTLRTASSILQRAIKAWSARLHNLHQRKLEAVADFSWLHNISIPSRVKTKGLTQLVRAHLHAHLILRFYNVLSSFPNMEWR